MRGNESRSGSLFSYVDLEARVPKEHPLRVIRSIVNDGLRAHSGTFSKIYCDQGRPPERLLLQALYGLRSERQIMERLDFDLLFRWFIGLGIDDPVWHSTVYAKNRGRWFEGAAAELLLAAILVHPNVAPLLSREHFSVDGTLIEAWASAKSFQPKGQDDGGSGNPSSGGRNVLRDFHGERRSNATHASTTDPDTRLFRKGRGKEARLVCMGHPLTENRNGLIVNARTTRAHGNAETLAAVDMLAARARRSRMTVGAGKGYHTTDFVMELCEPGITPHVAQNAYDTGKARRRSAIDDRTTRHPGYAVSQRLRKRIEECFGWIKTGAGGRKTRRGGLNRVGWQVTLTAAAYNLVRLPKLIRAAQ